jgi:hypothetical protein
MGKTVPSYRMALEFEIERWKGFRIALQSEEEREAFDWLMDMCRNNAMASGNACNPKIFEPMVMSIILSQNKKMRELGYKMYEVLWQQSAQTTSGGSSQLIVTCPMALQRLMLKE